MGQVSWALFFFDFQPARCVGIKGSVFLQRDADGGSWNQGQFTLKWFVPNSMEDPQIINSWTTILSNNPNSGNISKGKKETLTRQDICIPTFTKALFRTAKIKNNLRVYQQMNG